MKKTIALALLGSAMLAAAPASAATLLYNLTIEGGNNQNSTFPNAYRPQFTLTNNSTYTGGATGADALSAFLTSFKISFTGGAYVDYLTNFSAPSPQTTPGLTRDSLSLNPNVNGDTSGPKPKGFDMTFSGFNPGDSYQFLVDLEPTGPGNINYRDILDGAVIEVGFANGTTQTQTQTLGGFTSNKSSFSFSGGRVSSSGGGAGVPAAVPEPATWAMMILGFGVVGASMRSARRRKVSFAFA